VELVRAANPSPMTLSGTNTWLVGRDPCWVVDPGPDLDEHVAAVLAAAAPRGGIGGIAVTHDHADHVGAVPALVAGGAAARDRRSRSRA
jgi:glyoxylase-like metal-dependent hydrolase (beta-lactamase superfamily II)